MNPLTPRQVRRNILEGQKARATSAKKRTFIPRIFPLFVACISIGSAILLHVYQGHQRVSRSSGGKHFKLISSARPTPDVARQLSSITPIPSSEPKYILGSVTSLNDESYTSHDENPLTVVVNEGEESENEDTDEEDEDEHQKAHPEEGHALALEASTSFGPVGACLLGDICTLAQSRPLLNDGTESSPVWDKPRSLMKRNFASGKVKVTYVWDEPLVVYFDNVLDKTELNYLVRTATPRFSKCMVAGPDGVPIPDSSRTSDTSWVFISEDIRVQQIANKVTALAGFSAEHAEDIGVNRYQKYQFFKPHYDYMEEDHLSSFTEFRNCQRAATVLIYLSDVEEGGQSVFIREKDHDFSFKPDHPDHLAVQPKKGRVLIWYNMHPYTEKVDDLTLHAGNPVVKGTKIAATVFIRNCTRVAFTPDTRSV